MVTEIQQAIPPIPEGYTGNLTDEQEQKLKELWLGFFKVVEEAKGDGSKAGSGNNQNGTDMDQEVDPKKSGIPKDDKAKDEAKAKEEKAALDELLQQYGKDALRDTFWKFAKFDSPDTTILRFLRARKWDVSRAIAMLASCMKWRLDNGVESLAEGGDLGNGAAIEKFLEQNRSGKTFALGTALTEQPICYIRVRKHFTFGQPGNTMSKYVFYAMESFRLMMPPPCDKVVLFFDLTGFGLRNMDWNVILLIVKCLEAYYPESLGTLYIHNAPWIFSGIWKILGPLLDPVVRNKVVFTKKAEDVVKNVPAERLLQEIGGEVTDEFDFQEPVEGENDLLKDTAKREELWAAYMKLADEFEETTRKWGESKDEDGKLGEQRIILTKKLRLAQYNQEPYIRGKTPYHRNGTLDGQGKVKWVYTQKNGEVYHHIVGRKACAATLSRELKEIEEGKSLKEVQAKTDKALEDRDWIALYGDKETAEKLEGKIEGTDDAVEAVAANGEAAPATASKVSKNEEAAGAAAGGAAAGGAAGGAAAAAAEADASEAQDEFHEAPVASQADASKAVDGAEQAREKDLAIETNGHAESAPSAPEKREDAPPAEDKKKMSMTRRFSRSIKSKIMA